jgi:Fe2+ transport system protein FeoA
VGRVVGGRLVKLKKRGEWGPARRSEGDRGIDEPGLKMVSPLSRLGAGQAGEVAYVHDHKQSRLKQGLLQKLTAMGILPGAAISLVQTFPAYVFQVGQTQFAVDREIADVIHVRLAEAEVSAAEEGRRGWWWGRHWW